MKAICLGMLLCLLAVPGIAQRSPGFMDRLPVDRQEEYGSWRVLVTQSGHAGEKTFQLVSKEQDITVVMSSSTERPLFLRTSRPAVPGASLAVRIDDRPALILGAGSEGSQEILRQMLKGGRLVVEYDEWPSGSRTRVEAGLEGFADAWSAASVMMRAPRGVQAYLYEGCDDDLYCQTWTFCETGTPYCSVATGTCQCTQPPPGGGGGCEPIPCGTNQRWSNEACTCVCADVNCPPNQTQDWATCQCGCPDPGCPVPQVWNAGTCTCVCPYQPVSCPGLSVWNPDTCECEPR